MFTAPKFWQRSRATRNNPYQQTQKGSAKKMIELGTSLSVKQVRVGPTGYKSGVYRIE